MALLSSTEPSYQFVYNVHGYWEGMKNYEYEMSESPELIEHQCSMYFWASAPGIENQN